MTSCSINQVSYISGDLQGWSTLTHTKNRAAYMCLRYVYRVAMVNYIVQIAGIQDTSILLLYIENFVYKHRWQV